MLNGVNVVGNIGCGNYQITWKKRFEESEIWNSFSHPLPVIGINFLLFIIDGSIKTIIRNR